MMQEAADRLAAILERADSLSVDSACVPGARLLLRRPKGPSRGPGVCTLLSALTAVLAVVLGLQLHTEHGLARALLTLRGYDLSRDKCIANMPDKLLDWLRPTEDCHMCKDLSQVDRVSNILPEEFEAKYAYTGRPVVVTDGTLSWPGREVFSFQFFKQLYNQSQEQQACQFFPYETEFRSLREVFDMREDRALMMDNTKPWYIGWSNCDNQVARVLKQQYSRPYFLPETSENKKVDWIFMGSPGFGAKMHVDSVSYASWQAQLRGRKKWTLQPPPECFYQCNNVEITVNPGEIIVLDTNRWYHQTVILAGDMSITIGAEYD